VSLAVYSCFEGSMQLNNLRDASLGVCREA